MRKQFYSILFILGAFSTQAQIKFGLGFGYVHPLGDIPNFAKGGFSGYSEFGIGVSEKTDFLFRYQTDILYGADTLLEGDNIANTRISTFAFNSRFFLSDIDNSFRPFLGFGIGFTNINQDRIGFVVDRSGTEVKGIKGKTNFSIRPSVGLLFENWLIIDASYLNAGEIKKNSISDLSITIGYLFTL